MLLRNGAINKKGKRKNIQQRKNEIRSVLAQIAQLLLTVDRQSNGPDHIHVHKLTLALLDCTTETVTYGITALFNFLPKCAVFDHIQLAEGPAAVGKQYLFKLDYTVNKLGMVFAICHSSQRTYMLMFMCVCTHSLCWCVCNCVFWERG